MARTYAYTVKIVDLSIPCAWLMKDLNWTTLEWQRGYWNDHVEAESAALLACIRYPDFLGRFRIVKGDP